MAESFETALSDQQYIVDVATDGQAGWEFVRAFVYDLLLSLVTFFPLSLVQAQGYSQSIAGLADTLFALLLARLSPWTGQLADRYGPRLPLIIGPSLAGLGFLLMACVGLTDGLSDYWTTFFPGVVVFGSGMAITVASLTAAVMGSVTPHHSGTTSGINNAVSRTGGVLAMAIMGAIALFAFAGALEAHTAQINLSSEVQIALQFEADQLGQVSSVLAEVSPENVDAAETAIKLAFIDTFRVVMIICAGLAWLSALMAALLVQSQGSVAKTHNALVDALGVD